MKYRPKGFGLIELALVLVIIATISATLIPAFKHQKQRSQFREIIDLITPIEGQVNKCLGQERAVESCNTLEKNIPFGYSPTAVMISSLIGEIDLSFKNDTYWITVTPSSEANIYPFISSIHTYIRVAEVTDRDGRPIIEQWTTAPQSGCMVAGLC